MKLSSSIIIVTIFAAMVGCTNIQKQGSVEDLMEIPNVSIITADETSNANPKNLEAPNILSCGDSRKFEEFWLLVQSCHGMNRTYFSYLTKKEHLEQGCAFHTWIPNGRTYVVKRVTKDTELRDGLPVYRVQTRQGVLRNGGIVSPKSQYEAIKFTAPLPQECPYRR